MSENLFAQIAAQQQAAAASASPVSYILPSNKDWIRAQNVLKIYVVCHPITCTSGNGTTNHWTLVFDIGDGRSVEMNAQPDPQRPYINGGMKASIVISSLSYVVPSVAVRCDSVQVAHSRTVGFYVDYLESGGHFRYAFTSNGVGCRYWITNTLKLWAEAGEVSITDVASARHVISHLWPDNRIDEPAVGTYF
ncbi:hypothetical protein P280DRAFT_517598 [Massarina eburnea CBS 473.64]|uniref:DUF7770 domain-containing protein n=1 Tax=Massarina eburnea CBS 473.64 TaxID=1395130 RepID=A0A6A6S1K5_9PLEO|nr:hypothetical protein P280DRAFT_517598 [Massarina eburnea CBS 473.64]